MKRLFFSGLALAALLALRPLAARAQSEIDLPAAGVRDFSVSSVLETAVLAPQAEDLQSAIVQNLGAHLDELAPLDSPKGLRVEPKIVSNYLIQNVRAQGTSALPGSLLVESLADPDLARRAVKTLGSTPERRASLRRLAGIAQSLQGSPEWKSRLQRLQGLRRQTFSDAGDSKATAFYLLELFDGLKVGANQTASAPWPNSAEGTSFHLIEQEQSRAPPSIAAEQFALLFSKDAKKDLKNVSQKDFKQINEHIRALETNARPNGYKKLRGSHDVYRIRHGHWRVIYTIDDAGKTVTILRVVRRSEDTYKDY